MKRLPHLGCAASKRSREYAACVADAGESDAAISGISARAAVGEVDAGAPPAVSGCFRAEMNRLESDLIYTVGVWLNEI